MPTHHSLGPDDGYGIKNARAATIEPDEQSAVGPTQMQSGWCTLLEDIELVPQDQDWIGDFLKFDETDASISFLLDKTNCGWI
jgi:hypothetical protein